MFQIIKKFIAPNAIDGSKIKLLNNQSVRVLNTSAVEVEAVKVDGSNVLVLNSPEIDMSANIVKNISEIRSNQLKIGANQLAISEGAIEEGAVPALDLGANEMLSAAIPSSNDSLVNKGYVDGLVAALSSDAAQYSQYAYTLQPADITNGYVDLQGTAVHQSLLAVMDRQMLAYGVDYSLADVNNKTRLTFAGDIASGGNIAAQAGDILYFRYMMSGLSTSSVTIAGTVYELSETIIGESYIRNWRDGIFRLPENPDPNTRYLF